MSAPNAPGWVESAELVHAFADAYLAGGRAWVEHMDAVAAGQPEHPLPANPYPEPRDEVPWHGRTAWHAWNRGFSAAPCPGWMGYDGFSARVREATRS